MLSHAVANYRTTLDCLASCSSRYLAVNSLYTITTFSTFCYHFFTRDAMLARYVLRFYVVCPSTFQYACLARISFSTMEGSFHTETSLIRLVVSMRHRLVTDRQTDRHTTTAYTALAYKWHGEGVL